MYLFKARLGIDPKALMGVMQSKLFHFLYNLVNLGESRVIPQIKASKLLTLPTPNITQSDELIGLVGRMLNLHEHLANAKSAAQTGLLQRQIVATDAEIDRLVYDLYGLTGREITIVEGATK
jgi:hypothetical protein